MKSFVFGLAACVAGGVAGADVVAEYLPAERTQSNGLGGNNWLSQTFIASQSGGLHYIGLIVENRAPSNTVGLTLQLRPVVAGTDTPDMTGSPLASVTLAAADVPVFAGHDGFFASPESVLTNFYFNSSVMLTAGQEYAMVLCAPGSSGGMFLEYGWYTGPSHSNPAPDVNYAESSDNGGSFFEYGFNFDATYRVVVPTPGAAALVGLGGLACLRRRR